MAQTKKQHLLQTFIATSQKPISWDLIFQQTYIHGIFMIGAMILAIIDYLHCKAEH